MATKGNGAESALVSLISDAKKRFLSPKEVSARLAEIAEGTFAKRLQILLTQSGEAFIWGEADAPGELIQHGQLLGDVAYEVRAVTWPRTSSDQKLLPLLADLASALWGDDMRPMGGVSWKRESVKSRLADSIDHLVKTAGGSRSVAVLFGDLDKFKELNTTVGHDAADRAIHLVNRAFHDTCRQHGGLAFHPSGDEFYLILPMTGLLETLSALHDLRLEVSTHKFTGENGEEATVGMTLGMQIVHGEVTYEQVEQALRDAEAATKDEADKRRGQLSIAKTAGTTGTPVAPEVFGKLGAAMVRRRMAQDGPFPDARLGLIAVRAARAWMAEGAHLNSEVDGTLAWLGVRTTSTTTAESLVLQRGPDEVPRLAVALAVAAGVAHATASRAATFPKIELAFDDSDSVTILVDGNERWGTCSNPTHHIAVLDTPPGVGACVVGVQVGLNSRPKIPGTDIDLPTDVLEHVVIVDDRPSAGGGLPDFWQAALAQICEVGAKQDDPVHVLLWGSDPSNTETFLRLTGQEEWPEDEVAALAGVKSSQVRALREQLKRNSRTVNGEELAQLMYELLKPKTLGKLTDAGTPGHDALHREILPRSALESTDGLRCRDASQAYPLVIDVLRKTATRTSADDAHQELRELIAFKLVLQSPGTNPVPSYLRSQEARMQEYFDGVFAAPAGQLRQPLETTRQIEPFITQLVNCFGPDGMVKSTRRAVMVVRPDAMEGVAPSPLGLISVWASPRSEAGRSFVDFVYVWRTVEAFIGFPYSLYGSIRLAQSLMEAVNSKLEKSALPHDIRLGELIYLALSLHMRVDGVHQRIAKRIVDESSD